MVYHTMVNHGTPWYTMVYHMVYHGNTMVYHGFTMVWYTIPWFTMVYLTPRYSMAHHVHWGSSYTHCCRALTFASAGLSCC